MVSLKTLSTSSNKLHSLFGLLFLACFALGFYLLSQQTPYQATNQTGESTQKSDTPLPALMANYFPADTFAYWEVLPELWPKTKQNQALLAWLQHPWQLPETLQGVVQPIKAALTTNLIANETLANQPPRRQKPATALLKDTSKKIRKAARDELLQTLLQQQTAGKPLAFGLTQYQSKQQKQGGLGQVWLFYSDNMNLKTLGFSQAEQASPLWQHQASQLWALPVSKHRLLVASAAPLLSLARLKQRQNPSQNKHLLHLLPHIPTTILLAFNSYQGKQHEQGKHLAAKGLLDSKTFLQTLSANPHYNLAGKAGLAGQLLHSGVGKRLPWLAFHLQTQSKQQPAQLAVFCSLPVLQNTRTASPNALPKAYTLPEPAKNKALNQPETLAQAPRATDNKTQPQLNLKINNLNTLLAALLQAPETTGSDKDSNKGSSNKSSNSPNTQLALLQHLLPLLGLNWNEDVLGLLQGVTTVRLPLPPATLSKPLPLNPLTGKALSSSSNDCPLPALLQPALWLACSPEQWPLLQLEGGLRKTEKLNKTLKALSLWQQDKLQIKTSENRLGQFIQIKVAPKKLKTPSLLNSLFSSNTTPSPKKLALSPASSASPTLALADTGSSLLLGAQSQVEQTLQAYLKNTLKSPLKNTAPSPAATHPASNNTFSLEGTWQSNSQSRYTFKTTFKNQASQQPSQQPSQQLKGLWLIINLPQDE